MIRLRIVIPALAGLLLLALLLRLGFWQLERAAFKDRLTAAFAVNESAPAVAPERLLEMGEPERWQFRRVRMYGEFAAQRQYLLDNRTHVGRAGYHVLTVLPEGSRGVLVNRGWVPVGPDRTRLPDLGIERSSGRVDGRLVPPPRTGLLLGASGHDAAGWPKVVQSVDLERMTATLGVRLLPAVLLLNPEHPACYVCDWAVVPGISADRHRGYAVQWFALAAALLVIAVVLSIRARREREC